MATDTRGEVTNILLTQFKLDSSTLAGNPTFDDLQFDSLAIVEFLTAVERRTGVEIDEEEVTGEHTVADLLTLVASRA
jgi:acyl carrier protein